MGAERVFVTASVEATEELARSLGAALEAGAVIALSGDLGAGKTAFVRGLARGLDVQEPVTSPTFTLMQEHEGRVPFFHFDAWMTRRGEAFLEGGAADYLGGEGVAAVEWAERVEAFLPAPHLRVGLAHVGGESRRIALQVVGEDGTAGGGLERALAALAPPPGCREVSGDGTEPERPSGVPGPA